MTESIVRCCGIAVSCGSEPRHSCRLDYVFIPDIGKSVLKTFDTVVFTHVPLLPNNSINDIAGAAALPSCYFGAFVATEAYAR
jgi:hypothetical protein